ncbi:subtilisin-like protease-like protein [Paraphaeosphaeria sporulosa]|uniref:Subtilisin-like protease-like protein n=1 Tax=Paraphaeosphaeria sporulosa TaxID=1460663 RepID=A0A177BZW3_9PLEO|nr:subtilisin-like protease-like protein [Paraphaeosphaeria sporulosa]OAG00098.1 subtilisin-like protease-like protein [Paraphaeosphaeria sporulosa]
MAPLRRLLALATSTFLFLAHASPLSAAGAGQVVPGKWIVTLRPDADVATVSSHFVKVREIRARNVGVRHREVGEIERQYRFGMFKGYAGAFDELMVEELRELPEVLRVEEDRIMTTFDFITQGDTVNWGLASLSSRTKDAKDYIYDSTAGHGTYNYVVDTGVRITHEEFDGTRAIWGYNAVNDKNTDNAGHGTHVAGIIAGKTYGVAKNATIIAVKIFEGNSGQMSVVLDGFNWAVRDIVSKNRTSTAVINMSLGGAASATWDAAITAAWAQGVLAVVAAGNENRDASLVSPARSPEVLCVGNLQRDDKRYSGASGSNYGPTVDIFAPGTGIVSSYRTSDDAIQVLSGTSMAAPHVAGLVSYLRGSEGPMNAEKVKARVLGLATPGRVVDAKGSADLVAFNGAGE